MNALRLGAAIRKEFLQILLDPHALYIVLAIPVVQLFLLGYTATTNVWNVRMVVVDQDRSAASRRLLDACRAAEYFSAPWRASAPRWQPGVQRHWSPRTSWMKPSTVIAWAS